jgi:hypothetical protein
VGGLPRRYSFKPFEERYRMIMEDKGGATFLSPAKLALERFASALATISPPIENHIALLACEIRRKLPSLFG